LEETEDQVFTTEMIERAVTSEVTLLFGSGWDMSFYAGLGLGQSANYTALAVVQDVKEMNGTTTPGKPECRLLLHHLERYPLRTPYPR